MKRTKDECREIALMYKHIGNFRKEHPNVYASAYNNHWLNDITKHMIPLPSKLKRCVYEITFNDGSTYIGLTYNYDSRIRDHLGLSRNGKGTTVTRYMNKTNQTFTHKMISDYIDDYDAAQLEDKIITEYKDKGIKLLNKQKGGNLGTLPRNNYTLEYCKSVSLNYTTRTSGPNSFKKKEYGLYQYCQKQGWLDEVCSHMTPMPEITTVWNEQKIINYIRDNNITVRTGKGGLKDLNQSAYRSANRLNLLDKLLPNKKKNQFTN
jgi:predicted GIY-YIG superfamily endonuclease